MRDEVLLKPYVTEKTMDLLERHNSIVFIVRKDATKPNIKRAFERMFGVVVEDVRTKNTKNGKQAIIKLAKGYSAEEVGMRIGLF